MLSRKIAIPAVVAFVLAGLSPNTDYYYAVSNGTIRSGIGHFRTSVDKGIEIMDALRGWTSGLAVPHFVIDAPNGGGKVPVSPNYVTGREGKKVLLRNYCRKPYVYEEP